MTLVSDTIATPAEDSTRQALPSIFNDTELATLRLFCDTLIPSLAEPRDDQGYYARQASDLGVAEVIVQGLAEVAEPEQVDQLRLFLRFLEKPWFNALMAGDARRFSQMDLEARIALLHRWRTSKLNLRRKTFQSLKRLAMFIYYSQTTADGKNPNWVTLGYPTPPLSPAPEPISPISLATIHQDTVLMTDVVVVGSGAGGGVVAAELSTAGHDVLVLEKGGYYAEHQFDGDEYNGTQLFYENKGLLTSDDLSMMVLAGSVLGGGTLINWSASFRTPDYVLREWAEDYGITHAIQPAYQQAMDIVSNVLQVNTTESVPNRQNDVLEKGAQACQMSYGTIPRNAEACGDCGFCNFGCPIGAKRSTLRTYLQTAQANGARVMTHAHVQRVIVENGQAKGVVATVNNADGTTHQLTVRAKRVVIAAGSIHTPAILLRSGLSNPNIGRNLHLHPTTFTYGLYDEPVRGWSGKIMSRYIDSLRDIDKRGYGVIMETAPIHPGLSSLVLAWESPLFHKQTMATLQYLSGIIVLTRDYYGGQVSVNKYGRPNIRYHLHSYDAQHLRAGIAASLQVHQAAGAHEIGTSIEQHPTWHKKQGNLEAYAANIARQSLAPNTFALLSAHQMSSCRMGGNPTLGALKPSGETYEVNGLYVADASVLPTASGVNPMLTIMSMAYTIAQYLKAGMS